MRWMTASLLVTSLLLPAAGRAGSAAAQRWVDVEFTPSTLSRAQQLDELQWFADAARALRQQGVTRVRVVSELIDTHVYESTVLSKAFEEITGIGVQHEVIPEGELVDRLQASIQRGSSEFAAGSRTPT